MQKEYIPKRRRMKKFCSDSCRISSHQLRKGKLAETKLSSIEETKLQKVKV